MTRLILIRHGETDWNVEGRWQGQADVPLNERGRQQSEAVAELLRDVPIEAIYASDLQRAYETARAIARVKGLPIQTDPRLREIHQGEWQGLLATEIKAKYAEQFERRQRDPLHIAPPGGETVAQVRERVTAAVEEIIRKHPHGTVVIVSHGFALALVLVHFQQRPVDQVWHLIPENSWPKVLEVLVSESTGQVSGHSVDSSRELPCPDGRHDG